MTGDRVGQGFGPVGGDGAAPVPGRGSARVSSSAVVGAASVAGLGVPEEFVGLGVADELEVSDGRPAADLAAGDGESPGGLRSELRRQIRAKRRLRVITLMSLSVVVLGLLPLIFGIRSASRDPVFNSLDALDVPGWAASQVKDQGSGSRWCFLDCRFRERTAQSSKPYADTAKVYSAALTTAGWQRWKVGQCPEQPVTQGSYTCWKRDEFTLDLWVGPPECAVDQVAAQDPAALPSSGVVPTSPAGKCVGSTVSIKVQNAITDLRGRTDPKPNPSLVGETPDPTLAPDPLLSPTPTQS
jgi:integrin beta 3